MKKLVTLISLLLIINEISIAQTFRAIDETSGQEFMYVVIDKDNAMIIQDTFTTYTGIIQIPYYTYYEDIPLTISYIGDNAFSGCKDLTGIELSPFIKEIGAWAFANTAIDSISLPNRVYYLGQGAFQECSHLKVVESLGSIDKIGPSTFKFCDSLQYIYISSRVHYIDDNAFDNCTELSEITIDDQNNIYSSKGGIIYDKRFTTLYKCMPGCILVNNIPNTVSYMKEGAFKGCSKLKEVELPSSITVIPDEAFMFCFDLEKVVLPPHVIKIGEYAFSNCQSLKQINIPNSCKKIEYRAFETCLKLPSSIFPKQFRTPKMLKYIGK